MMCKVLVVVKAGLTACLFPSLLPAKLEGFKGIWVVIDVAGIKLDKAFAYWKFSVRRCTVLSLALEFDCFATWEDTGNSLGEILGFCMFWFCAKEIVSLWKVPLFKHRSKRVLSMLSLPDIPMWRLSLVVKLIRLFMVVFLTFRVSSSGDWLCLNPPVCLHILSITGQPIKYAARDTSTQSILVAI